MVATTWVATKPHVNITHASFEAHMRDDMRYDVTHASQNSDYLSRAYVILVANQLLWAYLQNIMVDFAHFWQAN